MKHPIKIFLISSQPLFLLGLRSALSDSDKMKVIGEDMFSHKILSRIKKIKPKIIIFDITFCESKIFQTVKTLEKEIPSANIIAISLSKEIKYIEGLIRLGIKGYLLWDVSPEELSEAIVSVNTGNAYFSRSIAKIVVDRLIFKDKEGKRNKDSELSQREVEILSLIAAGYQNKEIADKLLIGFRTVETHRERIKKKLNIHELAGLTRYAISQGFVDV